MLKKITTSILIILILIFSFTGCEKKENPVKKAPQKELDVVFENDTLDFGTVEEGEIRQLTYNVKNTGTKDLKVLMVRPTCGCTTVETWDDLVKPGETGKIIVNIDTKDLVGRVVRVVYVGTNVPGVDNKELVIRGTVENPVSIPSRTAWLGEIADITKPLTGSFTIINNTNEPLKLKEVKMPNRQTTYEIVAVKEDKEFRLDFTVNPPFKTGDNIQEVITIISGSDKERIHEFTYTYFVLPPIQVNPKSVQLDIEKIQEEKIERRINIKSNIQKPIDIYDIKLSGVGVTFSTEVLRKGEFYQIPLVFPMGFTFPEDEQTFYLTFRVKNDPSNELYMISIKPYEKQKE